MTHEHIAKHYLFRFSNQVSDSLLVGALLALSGGLMDVCSYLLRDHVFANAQTGNIILLGIHISEGNLPLVFRYLAPISAFAVGIVLAQLSELYTPKSWHWRQGAVFLEMSILFVVSFIPLEFNLLANCLTSLACGIQIEIFRTIYGFQLNTTMCVGNFRSAMHNLCLYAKKRKIKNLQRGVLALLVISLFASGAILGKCLIGYFGLGTIRICCFFLLIVFLLMFIDLEQKKGVNLGSKAKKYHHA